MIATMRKILMCVLCHQTYTIKLNLCIKKITIPYSYHDTTSILNSMTIKQSEVFE